MTLPEGEEESETSYSLSQPSFMKDVDRFTAHHELKVDRYGRAHGKYFSFYYEPYNFTFYYDRARNLVYLCAKKKVVNSFIEDIGLSSNWPKITVNYEAMIPYLQNITGAWFCQLKLEYLNTAGYFGPHVNRSEYFKKAAELGQISVLYISLSWPLGGNEYRVGITSDGAIILPKTMELEDEEIAIVQYVYDTFIAPTLVT